VQAMQAIHSVITRHRARTPAPAIPADHTSKEFKDIQDRAAYVYATGTYPTHLRSAMMALLSKIARVGHEPASLDGRGGVIHVDQEMVRRLDLDNHPMVTKAREFVKAGWKIQVARDIKARRPYGKVFLYRDNQQMTVQADGSIKEGW